MKPKLIKEGQKRDKLKTKTKPLPVNLIFIPL